MDVASTSMGIYDIQEGNAPYMKNLADNFTLSDDTISAWCLFQRDAVQGDQDRSTDLTPVQCPRRWRSSTRTTK